LEPTSILTYYPSQDPFSTQDATLSHQKYGITVLVYFNLSYLLFVFSFDSQNNQSTVKVGIMIAQKRNILMGCMW